PDPVASPLWGMLGSGLSLATKERTSQRTERGDLLRRARDFFEGADTGDYAAASRVMIARTLLAENLYEKARNLLLSTSEKHGANEIQIACQLGIARSYLLEGDLDRAFRRYLGGIEKEGASLLVDTDINLRDFCKRLDKEGPLQKPSPSRRIWALLAPDARSTVKHISQMFRIDDSHKRLIIGSLNRILRRPDFYTEKDFEGFILPDHVKILLAREKSTMLPYEVEWLNRMLLGLAFPQEINETAKGVSISALPSSSVLPSGILVREDDIIADLLSLAREYRGRFNESLTEAGRIIEQIELKPEMSAVLREAEKGEAVKQRRALERATQVNEFLLSNYQSSSASVLLETAEMYSSLAEVVGGIPFVDEKKSAELTAKAARTYLRVAGAYDPGTPREEEALWQASWGFYFAGQYGKAVEALNLYVERHGGSDRAGAALNLLGRSYRNLGEYDKAIKAFRSNSEKKTPDGRKSLYYLAWAYREAGNMENSDGEKVDLIGSPQKPVAVTGSNGLLEIDSALQACNRIRKLPGIGWESRPWRWATFELGRVWYMIAEREENAAQVADPAGEGKAKTPPSWIDYYRNAESVLQEGLERYLLKRSDNDPLGSDWRTEPEDYGEIMAARFTNEYYLALTRLKLADLGGDLKKTEEARRSLRHMLDTSLYSDIMFDPSAPRPYYPLWAMQQNRDTLLPDGLSVNRAGVARKVLGESEGPEYLPATLSSMRRNAFFILGKSLLDEADHWTKSRESLLAEGRDADAANAVRSMRDSALRAYAVYQSAYDRLPPRDAPEVLYMMGESLRKLGENERALAKYHLASNTASNLPPVEAGSPLFVGPALWKQFADQRIGELEYLMAK
ncbi:MAG: tetratricopeptide repeat protein, partial [Planctomycetes bacterium]|nr:tetratricopeptide repeat protein [Planctomycetota bacterium]